MSTYFWCGPLHFCVLSVSLILLINSAVIFFSTIMRQSDVEPRGYWWLYFGHIFFGMTVIHSDVEPPGSWWSGFGPLCSCLISGLVSTSPLLVDSCRDTTLRLWLFLWRYSCLITVWWIFGWFLVKSYALLIFRGPQ